MNRISNGASGVAIAIALSTPAAAQQTSEQPATRQPPAAQSAAAQKAKPKGGAPVIIVTAQRRNENLQDVPIAVGCLNEVLRRRLLELFLRELPIDSNIGQPAGNFRQPA